MNTQKKKRVFVLDGDMVPALTIARSLSRRNCVVDTASQYANPIAGSSNSTSAILTYPDPLSAESEFLAWLVQHTLSENYDLVIPVTERTLVPISRHREMFRHVQIAMPAHAALEVALDKSQSMELAIRLGVPVPHGVTVNSLTELSNHTQEIQYPVVLKPARSLGTNAGGSSQLKVSYAFDEAELRAGCVHGLRFGPILLQEYFKGSGVGIELIACNGRIEYAFQHLRLHEVPVSGGGSSLRKSVAIEPRLLDAAERLISALQWNGVAMVEFKWNPESGEFRLMEINGRFWGSLPLADAAGADFPSMLLDLELEGAVSPCRPYREEIYCRKLSSDCHWYEAIVRRGPEARLVDLPSGWEVFKELRLFISPRHRYDVQSICDPIPGLIDIGQIAGSYFHRMMSLLEEQYFFYRQRRGWKNGDVLAALSKAKSVLYLCYGNINRSALADGLSRAYLEDSGVAVHSAGFHQPDARPPDPVMVEVCRARGVDLSSQRSVTLTEQMLKESDVIFVMEKSHYDRLESMSPDIAGKTWLLGAHGKGPESLPEIGDPFGRSREEYDRCYTRISQAVDHIKAIIANRQNDLP